MKKNLRSKARGAGRRSSSKKRGATPRLRSMRCAGCGCSDLFGCDEGCRWIAPGVCSACVERAWRVLDRLLAE